MKSLKKGCILLIAVLLSLGLSACVGAQDWAFEDLPGTYEIWRINSQTISLVSRRSEYSADTVVESYVYEIAWTDAFIFAKQKPAKDEPEPETPYYIVDAAENAVTGPLSESAFEDLAEELGVSTDDLDWIGVLDLEPKVY